MASPARQYTLDTERKLGLRRRIASLQEERRQLILRGREMGAPRIIKLDRLIQVCERKLRQGTLFS